MFLNRLHCWLVCNVEHESYTLISFQDGKIKFPSSTMSKLLLTKLKVHSEAVLELSVIWHDLHQRTESLSCLLTFYSEHFKDLKVELQSSLFCPLKEQLTKQSHFKVHSAAVLQLHHMIINLQMSFDGLWAQSEETYCISALNLCRSTGPSWNHKVKDTDKRQ